MLKFTIKKDFRCFKAGQQIELPDKFMYIAFVGPNGRGKTTLFQTWRPN